ncbi:carboxymuconolactone decarboxylase family protein [Gracilibacillus sp. S3-1-1]|uniref:Carboxymuconolactone decarboxylase family protein n=1 Tax=Gracilibacillus pellucidus TaxID=3095368 RepID=A0ACC6M5L6_9BACI|nr:carboxymuconolactone decarboxylase family protein [Gracilibacillus sp. S3-1-1]MDX8046205.1 carboxymuconolactone decarboxylase family protein [Gracilibacillus sp. S3-1-1]
MNKREKGWANIAEIAGEQGIVAMEGVQAVSPRLANLALEFGYGDIYDNDALDRKQRTLITLSSLITQGQFGHTLTFHFKAALRSGLTKEEILELITHCSGYVGFPKAMNALTVFDQTYKEWIEEQEYVK